MRMPSQTILPRQQATSWEAIQPLIEMCWTGRLYDAQRWIGDGKPIDPSDDLKQTIRRQAPIAIAIKTGFHSLVELLVRSGCRTDTRSGTALTLALRHDHPDIAHMLLDLGADVRDASFSEVLTQKWDRTLVDRFIALGADTITDNPLAVAFCYGMRPALGVYMDYKDRFPQWREQLGVALVHHLREGSPRWVALLLWAGADPRSPVEASARPWKYSYKQSPLEVAVSLAKVDFVRRVGIDASRDDMEELLRSAACSKKTEMIKYTLEQTGQSLRGHPAGTEVIAEYCRGYSFSLRWPELYGHHESAVASGLCEMFAWGLPWQAADRTQTRSLRELLYRLDAYHVVQIVKTMLKHGAASVKDVLALLDTDRMSAHLRGHYDEIPALRERAERQQERAQIYFKRRERSSRERTRKELLKQAAREQALLSRMPRSVPLDDEMVRFFAEHPREPGNPAVFPSPYNIPSKQRSNDAGRRFSRWVKRFGPYTHKTLRHAFSDTLRRLGVGEAIRALILGHEDPMVTRIYTHPHLNEVRPVVSQLADIGSNPGSPAPGQSTPAPSAAEAARAETSA